MAAVRAQVFLGGCAIAQLVFLALPGSASNPASASIKIKGEWILITHTIKLHQFARLWQQPSLLFWHWS